MIKILEILDSDYKTTITKTIMFALPKWFSPIEDIERKSIVHRDYPFFAAFDGSEVIGFVTLKIHNKYTADIYNIGVLENYHRQGIGHMLIESCVKYCQEHKFMYLTVKTLDESVEYEPYNRTRSFYHKEGFIPLEVFDTVFDEGNPCLFMIKRI